MFFWIRNFDALITALAKKPRMANFCPRLIWPRSDLFGGHIVLAIAFVFGYHGLCWKARVILHCTMPFSKRLQKHQRHFGKTMTVIWSQNDRSKKVATYLDKEAYSNRNSPFERERRIIGEGERRIVGLMAHLIAAYWPIRRSTRRSTCRATLASLPSLDCPDRSIPADHK